MSQNNDNQLGASEAPKSILSVIHDELKANKVDTLREALECDTVAIVSKAGVSALYADYHLAITVLGALVKTANFYCKPQTVETVVNAVSRKNDDGTLEMKSQMELIPAAMSLVGTLKELFMSPESADAIKLSNEVFLGQKDAILELLAKNNISADFMLVVEYFSRFKSSTSQTQQADPMLAMMAQLPPEAVAMFQSEVLDNDGE